MSISKKNLPGKIFLRNTFQVGDCQQLFATLQGQAFHPRPQELTTYFKKNVKCPGLACRGRLDLTDAVDSANPALNNRPLVKKCCLWPWGFVNITSFSASPTESYCPRGDKTIHSQNYVVIIYR